MGQWTLVVQGQGTHHNGNAPFDADVIARQVAPLFEEHGHIIESVQLTAGGRQQVVSEEARAAHVEPAPVEPE